MAKQQSSVKHEEPVISYFTAIQVYFGWGILIFAGHVRDFFRNIFFAKVDSPDGYAPIVSDFEDFYTRRAYGRIHENFNIPISSSASAKIKVVERERVVGSTGYTMDLEDTGNLVECLNLGSYNYLGFGDADSPTREPVLQSLDTYGVSTCSNRSELGTTVIHDELEKIVARFLGKESSMIFGMGFGTNSAGLPALTGPGTLIISDSNNHSSIVIGARSSGAKIAVFKHNDMADLEKVIRTSIINGQPRTKRPWKRIMIVVEGIYSMEGEMCSLREIVALKKKYKCHLYVDEAHSVGAVGPTGRGVCDFFGVDPSDVDLLMGTFTKSFGAVGGYIAADRDVIDYLRYHCMGSVYSPSISPPACQQIITALKIIMGEDGTDLGQKKLTAIFDNANYFRDELRKAGFHVLGDVGSPVVPAMLYIPSKIKSFGVECRKRHIAVVVVGYPATPILLSRVRFCISAAHTREDLAIAIEKIKDIGSLISIRYDNGLI